MLLGELAVGLVRTGCCLSPYEGLQSVSESRARRRGTPDGQSGVAIQKHRRALILASAALSYAYEPSGPYPPSANPTSSHQGLSLPTALNHGRGKSDSKTSNP